MSPAPTTLLPNLVRDAGAGGPWTTQIMHWAVDARSHRVICLVLGVWLLNGFDLTFTILSHQQGVLHEENPLARHMLQYGTTPMILFKTGLVLVGSYPLLRFRTARITEMAAFLVLVAYVLLAIRWSTCYELYTLTAPSAADLVGIEAIPANVTP